MNLAHISNTYCLFKRSISKIELKIIELKEELRDNHLFILAEQSNEIINNTNWESNLQPCLDGCCAAMLH